jgi:hypothetical protein
MNPGEARSGAVGFGDYRVRAVPWQCIATANASSVKNLTPCESSFSGWNAQLAPRDELGLV